MFTDIKNDDLMMDLPIDGNSLDKYIETLKPSNEEIHVILSDLPDFLERVIKPYQRQDTQLISLISSITVLSSITARATFILRKRRMSPMLSTIIFAPPSSEKGLVKYSALLTYEVDKTLQKNKDIEQVKFIAAQKRYDQLIKKGQVATPPAKPSLHLLTFPANATSVAILDQLNHNGEHHGMLLVELELDIYVNSANKDHGNQNSAMLRLIGEQEPIRAATKGGGEVFVDLPKAAVLFVGTQSQVTKLFHSNDDGLYSRFLFFSFGGNPIFDLELDSDEFDLGKYAKELSKEFEQLYTHSNTQNVEVQFTASQLLSLQEFGKHHYKYIHEFMSENAGSLVKRHVNFVCRVASVLRLVDYYHQKDSALKVEVSDQQFEQALKLVKLSLYNALVLFRTLKGEREDSSKTEKFKFYDYLPNTFCKDDFLIDKIPFNISQRTVYNWLKEFIEAGLVIKEAQGRYKKVDQS